MQILMNSINHKQMELFSPSEFERWLAEVRLIDTELEKIDARRDYLLTRREGFRTIITAAQGLSAMPTTPDPPLIAPAAEVVPHVVAPQKRGTKPGRQIKAISWTKAIESIVSNHPKGVLNGEVRKEYKESSFATKLGNSEKSFYGAIAKLLDKKIIVRHKTYLFKPDLLKQFLEDVAKGLTPDLEEPANKFGHKSPFGDAIKPFLETMPGGATTSEIMMELRKTPEFSDTLDRHKTHLYNVLARLVDSGEVLKGGGKYHRNLSKTKAASQLPEKN